MWLKKALIATLTLITAGSIISCGGAVTQGSSGTSTSSSSSSAALSITSVTPTAALVSSVVTLQVSGSGFNADSIILWNGTPAATTVVDNSTVATQLSASALAQPGDVDVLVQDAKRSQQSNHVKFHVIPPLSITTTSLPSASSGIVYSTTLTATGGQTPYKWSLASGTLPSGITLNTKSGALAGTPSQSGTFNFTVSATDSEATPSVASQTLTLPTTAPSPLSITTTSLANATSGTAYSTTLAATGGQSPYKWSLASGSLPTGITLSTSGVLAGTPSQNGTFNFAISATDSEATQAVASQSLSLVVQSAVPALSITTANLSNATSGTAYSTTLAATGGQSPYTWALASGTLPTGLTLNTTSGVLAGTPSQSGTFNFTVSVKDSETTPKVASQSLSLVVQAVVPALSITTAGLSNATSGTAYTTTLAATGGQSPYTWALASGTLPIGLTLNAAGVLAGTPSQSGTFNFTVSVKDSETTPKVASQALSLVVQAAVPALSITTASLSNATSGTAYSTTLAATGGQSPYKWSLASGTFPTGMTLSTAGVLAGTPSQNGTFNFTVSATDSEATPLIASKAFSLVVQAALSITTTSLANATSGTTYSTTLAATGGQSPYKWSLASGTLPTGMTLSTAGVLAGTPSQSGTFNFTVSATDSEAIPWVASLPLSLLVSAPLSITTTSLPGGTVNTAYSTTVSATGGVASYSWSVSSGALPTGISLSSAGVVSGTPSVSGTFNVILGVHDSQGTSTTANFSITIAAAPALQITTTTLPNGTEGSPYDATVSATGGAPPYTWSISSGSLPSAVALAATTGNISGTPSTSGTFTPTLRVTDSANNALTQSYSFTISGTAYSVLLNWTASPSAGVTGYNVYRSMASGSGYAKITSSPIGGMTYTDTTVVDGQAYYYAVTSVDATGDESAYSENVQMNIP
jgi:hypothetical protein